MKTSLTKAILLTAPFFGLSSVAFAQSDQIAEATAKAEGAANGPSAKVETTVKTHSVTVQGDGKPVTTSGEIQAVPGKIVITTEVNGKKHTRVIDVDQHSFLAEPLKIDGDTGIVNADASVKTGEPVTWMGVATTELSKELAAQLPVTPGAGLLVRDVPKDSPADRAGLREHDVLVKFDDQILVNPAQLAVLVAARKEGESVKITYLRKGEAAETTVTLGKHTPTVAETPQAFRGLDVHTLKPLMRTVTVSEGDIRGLAEKLQNLKGDSPKPEKLPRMTPSIQEVVERELERKLGEALRELQAEAQKGLKKSAEDRPDAESSQHGEKKEN